MVFHVLNRGVARMQLFEKAGDYEAFERVLWRRSKKRPCGCVLTRDAQPLASACCGRSVTAIWPAFMQRFTITHVRRWQEHRR